MTTSSTSTSSKPADAAQHKHRPWLSVGGVGGWGGGGRYLVRELLPKDSQLTKEVHVFSTHFYTKLSEPLMNNTAPIDLLQDHGQDGDASGEGGLVPDTTARSVWSSVRRSWPLTSDAKGDMVLTDGGGDEEEDDDEDLKSLAGRAAPKQQHEVDGKEEEQQAAGKNGIKAGEQQPAAAKPSRKKRRQQQQVAKLTDEQRGQVREREPCPLAPQSAWGTGACIGHQRLLLLLLPCGGVDAAVARPRVPLDQESRPVRQADGARARQRVPALVGQGHTRHP